MSLTKRQQEQEIERGQQLRAAEMMFMEAMAGLPFEMVSHAFLAYIRDLPSTVDGSNIEKLGEAIAREGHMKGREV